MKSNIKYVFIGNAQAVKEIGEYQGNVNETTIRDARAIFERYCKVASYKYEVRNRVSGGEGNFYFTVLPTNIFYLVYADPEYNEANVFEMIEEIQKENVPLLVDEKRELNRLGSNSLKAIIDRYQQPKSKIGAINNDLNDIKIEMRQNVKKAMSNIEDVQVLDDKATKIKSGAEDFKKDATTLKKVTCMQNAKWTLILIVLVVGVLLIIILPIALSGNTSTTSTGSATNTTATNTTTPVNKTRVLYSKKQMDFIQKVCFHGINQNMIEAMQENLLMGIDNSAFELLNQIIEPEVNNQDTYISDLKFLEEEDY